MKHPDPIDVYAIGMIYLALHDEGLRTHTKTKVDMSDGDFNHCGTSGCHAGFFGIAMGLRKNRKYADFLNGEAALNEILFPNGGDDAEGWAGRNPKIWGGKCGGNMFGTSDIAFRAAMKKYRSKKISLYVIGRNWIDVGGRLQDHLAGKKLPRV